MPDSKDVRVAKTKLNILLDEYQEEHGLSDYAMLDALFRWQTKVVDDMRRSEEDMPALG